MVVVARRGEGRNEELERRLAQADRLVSLGTVTASVAHELKNPLAAILANLDFAVASLQAEPTLAVRELRELLEETKESAERARQIVGDVRALSRAGDDQVAAVDLSAVLATARRMVRLSLVDRAQLVVDIKAVSSQTFHATTASAGD